MRSGEYIWQSPDWPHWRYDLTALSGALAQVHRAQGEVLGKMGTVGFPLRDQAAVAVLTDEVVTTSAIEGEHLDRSQVRSSVARRLGVDIGALPPADRRVEGVVEMVLDATGHYDKPLTVDRLFAWQGALFPTGMSTSLRFIQTGDWRSDADGPMQVVSGPIGRERVHYEAPPAGRLDGEVSAFLKWFNAEDKTLDPVLKAGLAHLWFVTIHPFADGNGRVARAVGDMALARADKQPQRFYSLSAQIQRERKDYYDMLERTQKGSVDVTPWLAWFLGCLYRAIDGADETLSAVLNKAQFFQHWGTTPLNERQSKLVNMLLDGFEGHLTSGKWAKIAKCSQDTALRDIQSLVEIGMLQKSESGGRSTHYELGPLS